MIIESKCSCGEPISIETNRFDLTRRDGKRPFYPDATLPKDLDPERYDINNCTVFRCRKCKAVIDQTCKDAAFED